MHWNNLTFNRCPRCGQYLREQGGFVRCSNCQFFMTITKRDCIVGERERQRTAAVLERAEEDQAAEDRYWQNQDIM